MAVLAMQICHNVNHSTKLPFLVEEKAFLRWLCIDRKKPTLCLNQIAFMSHLYEALCELLTGQLKCKAIDTICFFETQSYLLHSNFVPNVIPSLHIKTLKI